MKKDGLNFKQKITVLAFFIFLGIVVIAQTEYAYKTDISQQKERARLNAKVYADELCIDFEGGKNITDALDDTVVASNGQVNNFARIAEHEMEDYISSIQLAPDSKVQYIYPLEGNEAGLIDLLADKKRGEIRQGGWKSERLPIVLLTGIIYQLFATAVVYLLLRTRQQHKELLKKAITDELTGLLSRRGLVEVLAKYKKILIKTG